jgi:hypothetical protein
MIGNPARIHWFQGLYMGFANFWDNGDVRFEAQKVFNFILPLETPFTVPKDNTHLCEDKIINGS